MKTRKNSLIISIIILICVIIIVLYLLILKFGYIRNNNPSTPTGNVDIFEIDCECEDDKCNSEEKLLFKESDSLEIDKDKPVFKENDNLEINKPDLNGLFVSDNYSMWGNERARIFSNPSYEYTSKIAPGSFNSYTFVIKNNNNFDVVVDFEMIEDNPYKVNIKYKLRSKGKYLVGDTNKYDDVSKLQLKNIKIKANESIPYILDWKWIDSENDTEIGEKIDANYKLTINIGANQIY